MAHCQHEGDVLRLEECVECNVTGLAPRYDQLAQALLRWPSDRRVALEDMQCVENQLDGRPGGGWIVGGDKLEYPVEVGLRARRELYPRHRLSRGRLAGLPAARAV